ncbi:hypothetical protein [Enterovibrio coralii]|uniref:Uncharacterized protein n=1 Tax=Enterovibrio coralii TaxID=294935 RepID=A0A135I6Y6_9GAMM|nr:hypothetical protein [Enterovibrio coralii]KXF81199.1 hypothetical protein ATN88_00040 [Enterovibrio coralii]
MAQTVTPIRLNWTTEHRKRFEEAGFTPAIVQELTTLGELWRFDSLDIVIRSEGHELVWMATLGTNVKRHLSHILRLPNAQAQRRCGFMWLMTKKRLCVFGVTITPSTYTVKGLRKAPFG